jgi:hypothetical protein
MPGASGTHGRRTRRSSGCGPRTRARRPPALALVGIDPCRKSTAPGNATGRRPAWWPTSARVTGPSGRRSEGRGGGAARERPAVRKEGESFRGRRRRCHEVRDFVRGSGPRGSSVPPEFRRSGAVSRWLGRHPRRCSVPGNPRSSPGRPRLPPRGRGVGRRKKENLGVREFGGSGSGLSRRARRIAGSVAVAGGDRSPDDPGVP